MISETMEKVNDNVITTMENSSLPVADDDMNIKENENPAVKAITVMEPLPNSPTCVMELDQIDVQILGKKKVSPEVRDGVILHVSSPNLGLNNKGRKKAKFKTNLPTLDETADEVNFKTDTSNLMSGYLSDNASSKKSKKSKNSKNSTKGKSRLKRVQELQKEATELAHVGEEEKAQKMYQNAIQIAGSEIARINFKIRKSQNSPEVTRDSIQARLKEDLRKIGITIGKLRTKMAILYERSGDYESSIACCREAIEIYKHQPVIREANRDKTADELLELMTLMVDRLELAHKALAERNGWLKEIETLRKEIVLTNDVIHKQELYQKVEKLTGKVKKMEIEALGDSHPQIAETYQLLSTIALEQNKQDQAVTYLQKAIKISKGALGMRHPRTGQYYLRLGRIYLSQGIESLALESFREATGILRHSQKFTRVLGSTFNDVAVIYMRRREYDLATVNLHEALSYYEKALKEQREQDAKTHKRIALSIDSLQVYRNLGESRMKLKDFDKAQESFQKVLELQREARKVHDLVKDMGFGPIGVEKVLLSLIEEESIGDSLMRLGRAAAADGKHEKALKCFKEALSILNRISLEEELAPTEEAMFGEKRGSRRDQATNTLYCIAEEYSAVGKYDEALEAYSESMRLRRYASLEPKDQKHALIHCILCFIGVGNVHLLKKDLPKAYWVFKKTLQYASTNCLPADHSLFNVTQRKIGEIEIKMAAKVQKQQGTASDLEEKAEQEIKDEKFDEALATLAEALTVRRTALAKNRAAGEDESDEIRGIACLLRKYGSVFARVGDWENGDRAYSAANKLFKKSGANENISI